MPINANILLGTQPQSSPLDRAARFSNLQDAMLRRDEGAQQLEQRAMQMQEFRRKRASQDKVNRLLAHKPDATYDEIRQVGGTDAEDLIKGIHATRLDEINLKNAQIDNQIKGFTVQGERAKQWGDAAINFKKIPAGQPREDAIKDWLANEAIPNFGWKDEEARAATSHPHDDISLAEDISESPKQAAMIAQARAEAERQKADLERRKSELELQNARITSPEADVNSPDYGLTPNQIMTQAEDRRKAALSASGDTVETKEGVYQLNPVTQRHDIRVGSPMPRATGSGQLQLNKEQLAYRAYAEVIGKDVSDLTSVEKVNALSWYGIAMKPPKLADMTPNQRASIIDRINREVDTAIKNGDVEKEDRAAEVQKRIDEMEAGGLDVQRKPPVNKQDTIQYPGNFRTPNLERTPNANSPKGMFDNRGMKFNLPGTVPPAIAPPVTPKPGNALPRPKQNGQNPPDDVIDAYLDAYGNDPAKTRAALTAAGWKP